MINPKMALPRQTLADIDTPFLALDIDKMDKNVARLATKLNNLGAAIRPHLKTVKSIDASERILENKSAGATVSTLKEAEELAAAGFSNLLYAVGIDPSKLPRVIALRQQGVDISILLDSEFQAHAVVQACINADIDIAVLIEIDCDGHRGGILADDPKLLQIAAILKPRQLLRGGLNHAGEAYNFNCHEDLVACAENERATAVAAANNLRKAGFNCPVISIGSSPTAHFSQNLSGVTEVRAGVYVFFDLVMAGIGVCQIEDIALSVVTTVIGHREDKGWIMIDAGWMALSRDRGTARQKIDQGYGLVCDLAGVPIAGLIVADVSQEHGQISLRADSTALLPQLEIGTRLRILPNHACATGAQHSQYYVVSNAQHKQQIDCQPQQSIVQAVWPRIKGW
ncbi:MAG: alanine racemase domain-containing protein [Osedax symbiont Rs2]|nr:MAG: alanine racemase domain-containing protein [Osedax symbiont Rs2]